MCCRRVYVYAGLSSDVLNKYWEYIGQRSLLRLLYSNFSMWRMWTFVSYLILNLDPI